MALAVTLTGGCAHKNLKPPVPTPEEELARKTAYVPAPGTPRAEAEAQLGNPTGTGRTKEGNLYCLYEIGEQVRSATYDATGKVVDFEPRGASTVPDGGPPAPNEAQPKGALTGATIFVSPGHGWVWGEGKWSTQRGLRYGIVEDHSNAEAVLEYLVPYLWNAGANVYTMRERDLNTNMVLVPSGGKGFTATGEWSSENPEGAYERLQYATDTVSGPATATATFTPEIAKAGDYAVYLWYAKSAPGEMARAAKFRINHTGGTTTWTQNLNHDSRGWKYAGTYHFAAGASAERGSVVVDNSSDGDKARLAISAVRFGGGMGDTIRNSAPSGKPRFEESGIYFAQYSGYDPIPDTRRFNTVSAMPRWSEWELEPWEKGKSIYVSWHTNASGGDGKGKGFSSYIYGPNAWGPVSEFTGYPGGLELQNLVHEEVVNDVRKAYYPGWRDIGKICRWLGETNPRNNNRMPAALFEYGFHDNVEDAPMILDPKFRRIAARATYQGIVKFYAQNMQGFKNGTLLPEPPTQLRVESMTGGLARVTWSAPPSNAGDGVLGDPATGYRVYTSRDGKGFDNGRFVADVTLILDDVAKDQPTFVRVAATNAGGESLPTETLCVKPLAEERANVLVVNGFDRLDTDLSVDVNGNKRGLLARMNTYDYSIQHGLALAAAGYNFDSTSDDAVTSGMVTLDRYKAVVWILGREKNGGTFDAAERPLVAAYLAKGGALFLSGSDVASDLKMSAPAFLADTFHADFVADNAGAHQAAGVAGSIFDGVSLSFDDGNGEVYEVESPDVISAQGGAKAALTYGGGAGQVAAIQYEGAYRLVYTAFPFEAINEVDARQKLMKQAMGFLVK